MGKESENLTESLRKSPHMVTIIIVVGAFLLYLYRHDELENQAKQREDLVAVQRIEQCHHIQEDSNRIMEKLNITLNSQGNAFHELSVTLRDLKNVMTTHNSEMNALLMQLNVMLTKLEAMEKRLNKLRAEEEANKDNNNIPL